MAKKTEFKLGPNGSLCLSLRKVTERSRIAGCSVLYTYFVLLTYLVNLVFHANNFGRDVVLETSVSVSRALETTIMRSWS